MNFRQTIRPQYAPEYQRALDAGAELLARIEAREHRDAARLAEQEAAELARIEATREKMKHTQHDGYEIFSLERPASLRRVHGIASTSTRNSHGYALLSKGCTIQLPIPLYYRHKTHAPPCGWVVLVRKRERELYIQAILNSDECGDIAFRMVEDGTAISFSAAADPQSLHLAGHVAETDIYDQWSLAEVSLVKDAANLDCQDTVEVFGADPVRRRRVVTEPKVEAPNDDYVATLRRHLVELLSGK